MKRLLLSGIIVGCCLSMYAQNKNIHPGLKAGISVPDIRGNTEQSQGFTSRLAPYFGISLNKYLFPDFNLQVELNYSPQGGKRNGLQPIDPSSLDNGIPQDMQLYASFKNQARLNYLELPVLLQLSVMKTKMFFYHINLGPYVSLNLNDKTKTSGSSSIYTDKEGLKPLTMPDGTPYPAVNFTNTENIKDEIKRFSMGIIGGIGAGYLLDIHKVYAEARFTRGLTNIQKHPEQNGKNKTGSVVFVLGYIYDF